VSTVCDGIADLLQRDYRLKMRPAVVRSIPQYRAIPFRPAGETVNILYHGLLVPTRGLETAIESVRHWRPEFRFQIRGVGDEAYIRSLKLLAEWHGVTGRVDILPPVPFVDLVPSAAAADIGYVVLDNYSPQRTFTLPNKFFEYVMAGLAVLASDLPEMAKLTRRYGFGILVPGMDPQKIAAQVNRLDRATIDRCREAALDAAQELCWENEQKALIDAYDIVEWSGSQDRRMVSTVGAS
jgi:glycosyltransferase involved in cell wall biosynthesis